MQDGPDYDTVSALALDYFASAGIVPEVTPDGLKLEGGEVFGLEPVRRRLAAMPQVEWVGAITRHFDLLMNVDHSMPETFADARLALRSAVVDAASMGLFDGALFERPLTDGLGERLMLRRGETGMTVTAETVEGWGTDHAQVWSTARANTLDAEPYRVDRFDSYVAYRGGRWTSTRLLDIANYPGTTWGSVVIAPARDEVLAHRIVDDGFTDAVLAMLAHAVDSFVSSPLPLTCDVYWAHDGRLDRICEAGGERFKYIRVPEFSAMLWQLEADIERRKRR